MTCRGYSPKAIKIPKDVKRLACTIFDKHKRGQFIRDYVKIYENQSRSVNKKGN